MEFKFKWLDPKGHEQGFRSLRGGFDGNTLILDEVRIPAAALVHVDHRDQRMILAVVNPDDQTVHLLFTLKRGSAAELKEHLGVARSAQWAHAYHDELQSKGLGHLYRSVECPHCGATLILAGMPETPQLYCQFCDALSTLDGDAAPPGEHEFKICDECGMFSKPRRFTIFYFYFLLVVHGWHSRTTWRCPGCMRGDAWKMFFGNLLFVLGVPVALVQLVRAYGGSLGGAFAGLDTANLKARKGDIAGAVAAYGPILDRVPTAAGVKYNLGRALLQLGELDQAVQAFRMSLDDCGNYAPSYHALLQCYERLGAADQAAELKQRWDPLGESQTQDGAGEP